MLKKYIKNKFSKNVENFNKISIRYNKCTLRSVEIHWDQIWHRQAAGFKRIIQWVEVKPKRKFNNLFRPQSRRRNFILLFFTVHTVHNKNGSIFQSRDNNTVKHYDFNRKVKRRSVTRNSIKFSINAIVVIGCISNAQVRALLLYFNNTLISHILQVRPVLYC